MKTLILTVLVFSFINNSLASDRVSEIIIGSADERLDQIQQIQTDIGDRKTELMELTAQFITENKKNNNQKIGIVITTVGAIGVLKTVIGVARANARNNAISKALYIVELGIPSVLLVSGGTVMAVMNNNEAKAIQKEIDQLLISIKIEEALLKREVNILCKSQPQHKLCY